MPARARREFKPRSRVGPVGLAVMAAVHVVIGIGLVYGLGRHVVEVVKKPLNATIVQEVQLPPPPPPPPPPPREVARQPPPPAAQPPAYVPPPVNTPPVAAPSPLAAVQSAEPVAPAPAMPAPPAAPAPAAPPVPPAPPKPVASDMAVVCPKQVRPEMPDKAIEEGIGGTVRAEARIRDGRVVDVKILSGNKLFHAPVRRALQQYECIGGPDETIARQDFEFKVE
ncbi:hypothetical protein ASF44_10855 [Pseudorhodoferax sp. Leaf274]|nr:hypothetical protein ASF44_10855 [Pseudorhodoferax sp. Leaf274]